MGKKGQKTTTRTVLDPKSQGFVDLQRELATQGALGLDPSQFVSDFDTLGAFQQNLQGLMNPFTSQVIGGLGEQYDQLRGSARTQAAQQAARLGAFGGAGHGVESAIRQAELDRAQGQQVSGLLSNQFNTAAGQALGLAEQQRLTQLQNQLAPLQAAQAQLGLTNLGLGPTGQIQTQRQPGGSLLGTIGGGLLSAFAGPLAGVAGGLLGGGDPATGGAQQAPGIGMNAVGGFMGAPGGYNLAPPGLYNPINFGMGFGR